MGLRPPGLRKGNNLCGLDVPLAAMNHEKTVAIPTPGTDWKGLGYLVSIVSVFFLGVIAWPKPEDPAWHLPVLLAGMATSIIGMGFRYKAHRGQQREIKKAETEAERR
jgi:hypothetical protein